MKLQIFQVDAFSDSVFKGNPAAIVPLETWLADEKMLAIAAENNLAETAFFVPIEQDYQLRWFTPTQEVVMCGHATLATAHVLFSELNYERTTITFHTLSGTLSVTRGKRNQIKMDFPVVPPQSCSMPDILEEALGCAPKQVFADEFNPNYYAVLEDEAAVNGVEPDMALLKKLHPYGVVVTAKGSEVDFVSRSFAPSYGIPEDPVTGSIHCTLVPYWREQLRESKNIFKAYQASARGGALECELVGDRILISGQAATYLTGTIDVPD